jgi:hypothetical protein
MLGKIMPFQDINDPGSQNKTYCHGGNNSEGGSESNISKNIKRRKDLM